MLPESAKKLREPLAALLLTAALIHLVVYFLQLFKDVGSFAERALLVQDIFIDPAWALVLVAAALLVTSAGEPTPRARLIVLAVLGVLALMALLAMLTWLAGLGADLDFSPFSRGKVAGSFATIAGLMVIGAAAWWTCLRYAGLPKPIRPQPQQQQWGPPQQQLWGQQPWGGQQQWGGQPPMQQPPAPAPGQGWGQPPPQQPWGPPPQPPPQQTWGAQPPPEAPADAPGHPEDDSTAGWAGPERRGRFASGSSAATDQEHHSADRPDDESPQEWRPPS